MICLAFHKPSVLDPTILDQNLVELPKEKQHILELLLVLLSREVVLRPILQPDLGLLGVLP
jgi:hypothetical protein